MAVYGVTSVVIPKPTLGDAFVRTNAGGQHEESAILSVVEFGASWKATMLSAQGYAFVSSQRGTVGENDWRPVSWVWGKEAGTYHDPGYVWVDDYKNPHWDAVPVIDVLVVDAAVDADNVEVPVIAVSESKSTKNSGRSARA